MKRNTLFFRKPFWSTGSNIPGLVLVLAGISVLLSPLFGADQSLKIWLVGFAAIGIGAVILTSYSGVLLDLRQKRFKRFDQIAGWKFGDWEDLSSVEKVDIIQHEYRSTNIPNGVSPTLSGLILVHKLVLLSDSKVILEWDYSNAKKAAEALQRVKEGLGLPS